MPDYVTKALEIDYTINHPTNLNIPLMTVILQLYIKKDNVNMQLPTTHLLSPKQTLRGYNQLWAHFYIMEELSIILSFQFSMKLELHKPIQQKILLKSAKDYLIIYIRIPTL